MANIIQRILPYTLFTQIPQIQNLAYNHRTMIKIRKLTLKQYYCLIFKPYTEFTDCSINTIFFPSEFNSGHIPHLVFMSPKSPLLCNSSSFLSFICLSYLDLLKSTGQLFWRIFLSLGLFDGFLND